MYTNTGASRARTHEYALSVSHTSHDTRAHARASVGGDAHGDGRAPPTADRALAVRETPSRFTIHLRVSVHLRRGAPPHRAPRENAKLQMPRRVESLIPGHSTPPQRQRQPRVCRGQRASYNIEYRNAMIAREHEVRSPASRDSHMPSLRSCCSFLSCVATE